MQSTPALVCRTLGTCALYALLFPSRTHNARRTYSGRSRQRRDAAEWSCEIKQKVHERHEARFAVVVVFLFVIGKLYVVQHCCVGNTIAPRNGRDVLAIHVFCVTDGLPDR